jgi:hypothetical protein
MRSTVLLAAMAFTLTGCQQGPELETRTFSLQYLQPAAARGLIEPYVFADRAGHPGVMSFTENTMTVRETADNLDKIARVLAQYDVSEPWVQLHFQVIEADGASRVDPRIADVETQLRKLFRFEGYRLVADAQLGGTARSSVGQEIAGEGGRGYNITVGIGSVRAIGDSGVVELHVELRSGRGAGLMTSLNARDGQTVVLGNAQLGPGTATTILTVRPVLVRE